MHQFLKFIYGFPNRLLTIIVAGCHDSVSTQKYTPCAACRGKTIRTLFKDLSCLKEAFLSRMCSMSEGVDSHVLIRVNNSVPKKFRKLYIFSQTDIVAPQDGDALKVNLCENNVLVLLTDLRAKYSNHRTHEDRLEIPQDLIAFSMQLYTETADISQFHVLKRRLRPRDINILACHILEVQISNSSSIS